MKGRSVAWIVLGAVGPAFLGCGDSVPPEPDPLGLSDIAGVWDFTEVLVVSNQVSVCHDTGSIRFELEGDGLVASGRRVGTCEGLVGSFPVRETLAIEQVELRDSTIQFTVEAGCGCGGSGCSDARYVGRVTRGPPLTISGTNACSINFDGEWDARPAAPVAALTLVPDSTEILVEETIFLNTVMQDQAGARVFERAVVWSSSDELVLAVGQDGAVLGVNPGIATISATLGELSSQARVSVGAVSFSSVGAGAYHTCGLSDEGGIYCWGANDKGQSGPAASLLPCPGVTCRRAPGFVPGVVLSSGPSLGYLHSCGLDGDGVAHCWGFNAVGQLGRDLSTTATAVPLPVSGDQKFSVLSAGANHVCGVAMPQGTFCWGLNNRAQLGSSAAFVETQPTEVGGAVQFHAVTSGEFHTCALTSEGQPYCWGFNWFGQLGVDSVPGSALPQPVAGDLHLLTLSAGAHHNCGLTATGEAYCWGRAIEGQLGAEADELSTEPLAVGGGLLFESVSSGGLHTCAVTADGLAYCWGAGSLGRLGNGLEHNSVTPVAVAGENLRFRSLSSGFEHTCGITLEGIVYCWGSNYNGQVGIASLPPALVPQRVVGQR